jgi:tellurium resistance protein TerD
MEVFMKINLEKGQVAMLNKETGVQTFTVGAGWDIPKTTPPTDIDIAAILIKEDGSPKEVVYFGNLQSTCKCVKLSGDNRTGAGEGYDEEIVLDFSKASSDVAKVVLICSIYSGADNFGLVKNLNIDVIDGTTKEKLASFLPDFEASLSQALVLGEFIKRDSVVGFKALGLGHSTKKQAFAEYGIES